jgi:hypothetical protein
MDKLEYQKRLQAAQAGATTPPGFSRFKSLFGLLGINPNEDVSDATYEELNKKMAAGIPFSAEETELYNRYRGK